MKIIIILIFTLLIGCTKNQTNQSNSSTKTLNLFCWANYFAPSFIKSFEEKTGAKVVMSYFSSNEELLAKLQAGATGYDLIVPSGYLLKPLKELGLIQNINAHDWPELTHLSPRYKNSKYDSQFEFSIPYQSGTTGLAVNTRKVTAKVDSLSWLFSHPELKGQIGMLDDAPTVIGTALKFLGFTYNESSDAALNKAKSLLIKQKPILKMYTAEPMSIMESGEIAITQAYSGDVEQAKRKNPNLIFVHPKEGGELFIDYLSIPKGAQNIELAKEFMKLSLNKEIAVKQTMHLFYSPAIDISGEPSSIELLKNKVIFPSDDQIKSFETLEDNPERLEKIQKIWLELKSS